MSDKLQVVPQNVKLVIGSEVPWRAIVFTKC